VPEDQHGPAAKATGTAGDSAGHWVPGVAVAPPAQGIVDRLVWKMKNRHDIRADALLATTAATLCLDHDGADGRSLNDHLAELARRDDIVDVMRGVLTGVVAHLWNGEAILAPLLGALDGPRAHETAQLTVDTLARARVGDFVTGRDPFAADLLGMLHTETRSQLGIKGSGAFYTPENVALMIGMMSHTQECESILEPAIGTGGMFLGLARAMRMAGRRPHRCTWTGIDIDPLAIACAAVNSFVWMLGPFVRLVVANALTFDTATLPAPADPSFSPIIDAWNMRALATWARRGRLGHDSALDAREHSPVSPADRGTGTPPGESSQLDLDLVAQ
jgi:hypothetical protein